MKKLTISFLFASWITSSVSAADPVQNSPDEVLRSFVESGRIQKVVAMAATKDRILHQGAFGKVYPGKEEDVKVDAIFPIASMTKPVTSIAVMQLVERGQLDLDGSIGGYLEEFAEPQVLRGFDDAGKPLLKAAKRPPTIRELLSNSSGLAYAFWNEGLLRYEQPDQKRPGDAGPISPLASEPGTRWAYGPGTEVLGRVVEKISGLNLEDYFRKHIFGPLGMEDTFYQFPGDKWGRLSRGLSFRGEDGDLVAGPWSNEPEPTKMTEFFGDRGLSSTASDYLRFVRAFLNGGELDGKRILKPETVALMSQNQIGELEVAKMSSVVANIFKDVHFYPEAANKFGLGFFLNGEAVPGGRAAGSLMWGGALNTFFWIDLKSGVGGVVMTQMVPFPDGVVLEMVEAYEKAVYALVR